MAVWDKKKNHMEKEYDIVFYWFNLYAIDMIIRS